MSCTCTETLTIWRLNSETEKLKKSEKIIEENQIKLNTQKKEFNELENKLQNAKLNDKQLDDLKNSEISNLRKKLENFEEEKNLKEKKIEEILKEL